MESCCKIAARNKAHGVGRKNRLSLWGMTRLERLSILVGCDSQSAYEFSFQEFVNVGFFPVNPICECSSA